MKKIKVGFTDFWPGFLPEKSYFIRILNKYFQVEVIDTRLPDAREKVEYLFCSVFSQNFLDFDCIRIFYTGENIIPDFNLYDYAIGFEKMTIGDRYFCDPLCYGWIRTKQKLISNEPRLINCKKDIKNKKFCAMVVSNGSNADPFRTDFFHSLSQYKTVDSGGSYLNNIGYNVDDKIMFLKDYKFSFAIENVSHEGYCTEKIVESFAAGTIPIYWGDPDVMEYFNDKAFINCHKYSSTDEIINEVKKIDTDGEKFFSMLEEPVFSSDFYTPSEQDIRFEKWLISIFERRYMIRRNRIGAMKNYEYKYRKQRELLQRQKRSNEGAL